METTIRGKTIRNHTVNTAKCLFFLRGNDDKPVGSRLPYIQASYLIFMDKIAITCILQVFFGLDLKTIKELQGPMLLSPVSDHLDPTGSEKRAFDAWKCAEIKQTHWPIRIPTNTGYYYMITIHLVPQQVRCFFITLFLSVVISRSPNWGTC